MKKVFLTVACGALLLVACKKEKVANKEDVTTETAVVDTHTTQNSVDWEGVYEGILPCADCEGIQTAVELKADNTFKKSEEYLGEEDAKFETTGAFFWDKTGSIVVLENKEGEKESYRVGEGSLTMLDAEGNSVEGELVDAYILRKK